MCRTCDERADARALQKRMKEAGLPPAFCPACGRYLPEAQVDLGTLRKAEAIAAALLRHRGMEVVEEDYVCDYGRVPFVASDEDGTLVLVDVIAASGPDIPSPGARRSHELARCAWSYVNDDGCVDRPVRFDVVAVKMGGERALARYHVNAFGGGTCAVPAEGVA